MNFLQTSSMEQKHLKKDSTYMIVGVLLVIVATILSLCLGAVAISPSAFWQDVMGQGDGSAQQITLYVRLPRTMATLLAGASLSLSGMIIQSVLNNPLASPNIIGVNAGAGFMTTLVCALFPAHFSLLPIAAFVGALLAVLLVYGIGWAINASRTTMIMAGVAINSILYAGIDTIVTLVPDALTGNNMFRIGGVEGVTFSTIFPQGFIMLAAMAAVFFFRNELDVLSLGSETAQSLGMNVAFYRFLLLTLAALLAGLSVSFAGLIGFVGLLVPHIARRFVGVQSKVLIPFCILLGASFLTFCDLLARTLFAPFEIPVGLVLSFLGGPFFLWLLIHQKRRKKND